MLVALVTAHRRVAWWPEIANSLSNFKGLGVLLTDNGHAATEAAEAEFKRVGVALKIVPAPFNPLEPGRRERFCELRQWQVEKAAEVFPEMQWYVINDDDQWPSLSLQHDVQTQIATCELTLLKVPKVYFADPDGKYVLANMPPHVSGYLHRYLPGDFWDAHYPSPVMAHRGLVRVAPPGSPSFLLDFGYCTAQERRACWDEYRRTGKIDAVTRELLAEPVLRRWGEE